jgi:hypothetical protein
VNLGTEESPDWRIALTATKPGDTQPDILASDGVTGPFSLQEQQARGSDLRSASRTAAAWNEDDGPPLNYQLSLGGVKYSLAPAGNSAAAVAAEINAQHGDKVQAAVVDLGPAFAHDYRITPRRSLRPRHRHRT